MITSVAAAIVACSSLSLTFTLSIGRINGRARAARAEVLHDWPLVRVCVCELVIHSLEEARLLTRQPLPRTTFL